MQHKLYVQVRPTYRNKSRSVYYWGPRDRRRTSGDPFDSPGSVGDGWRPFEEEDKSLEGGGVSLKAAEEGRKGTEGWRDLRAKCPRGPDRSANAHADPPKHDLLTVG